MSKLHRAIELAIKAHAGQDDPPGEPYILHPMRVMLALPEADHELRCVAILHDALERGSLTKLQLEKANLGPRISKALELLTHDADVSYADYVLKLKPNALARAVKLADLEDNAALRYVDFPINKPGKGKRRVTRYVLSHQFLNDRINEATYRRLMKKAE